MICKNCKKEIDNDNFLCPYCSYNVAKQAEKEQKLIEKKEKHKMLRKSRVDVYNDTFKKMFLVFFATILISILYIFFSNKKIRENNEVRKYTEANLCDIDEKEKPFRGIYKFEVNGNEYIFGVDDVYDKKENIPKNIIVKYSIDNPNNILGVYERIPSGDKEMSYSTIYVQIIVFSIFLLLIKLCEIIVRIRCEIDEKKN